MTQDLEPDVWGNRPTSGLPSAERQTAAGSAADPVVEDAVELDEPPPQPDTTTARGATASNVKESRDSRTAADRSERWRKSRRVPVRTEPPNLGRTTTTS
jgi:hypothetical protein